MTRVLIDLTRDELIAEVRQMRTERDTALRQLGELSEEVADLRELADRNGFDTREVRA
ncbi:MAG TPA: hypothetical protein VIP28_01755 [Nocardioides sp.]